MTGDPRLIQATRWELTPQDHPLAFPVRISAREATITALDNRPDIAQSIRRIQAISARVGAAKNQVLPRLDLILGTYVAGLDSKTDVFGAFANQFSDGGPSYAAGLLFEIPLGNRASKARLTRNKWELTRSLFEFQQTTEVAFTDIEIAVRETHTAFDEMASKKQAIDAASREVSYLKERWELLPDPNESAVLLIEDLLDAQERLADEEQEFVRDRSPTRCRGSNCARRWASCCDSKIQATAPSLRRGQASKPRRFRRRRRTLRPPITQGRCCDECDHDHSDGPITDRTSQAEKARPTGMG